MVESNIFSGYDINISNRIYTLRCNICEDCLYVHSIFINFEYRKRGYSRRIFNNLQKKYNMPLVLLCYRTLLPYYKKLGFRDIFLDNNGYYEMIRE